MEVGKRTIGWVNWNREFKKKGLTPTLENTYNLFKEGNSIITVAKKRGFKQESIERQIVELITMEMIDVNDVLEKAKLKKIISVIDADNINNLSKIKEKLSDNESWFEIKCTLAYINSIPYLVDD